MELLPGIRDLWEHLGASQIQAPGSLLRVQTAFNPGTSESTFLSSSVFVLIGA